MSGIALFAVALVIAVGLVGIVVPVLPGTILVLGGLLAWALAESSTTGWVAFGVAAAFLVAGQIVKYVVPGRHLARQQIPSTTMLIGAAGGIAGFFLIPIVGLPVGFVAGVFAAEEVRLRSLSRAWSATWAAIRATGLSILIELGAAMLATGVWVAAVVATR